MSVRERAASVIMATAPGTDAGALRELVIGNGLGGFIVMGGNVPADSGALREIADGLTADAALPPLIGIDQEGGEVSRLPWDEEPGADRLKNEPAKRTRAAFAARAALLAEAGVNVNFGIVADVPSGEGSFIYGRALGTGPRSAADRVAAAVAGERSTDGAVVASTLKHFPGHGAAEGDSHSSLPTTEMSRKTWRKTHARPFVAGIDAGAELLMFGHLVYTSVDDKPASLSQKWHRIAREELGFTGVVVSDDLGMLLSSGVPGYDDISKLVVESLTAGTDLALVIQGVDPVRLPQIIDDVADAVEAGKLPEARLQEAAERLVELRLRIAESAAA